MGDSISAWHDEQDQRNWEEESAKQFVTSVSKQFVISVYMDDGRVFEYDVDTPSRGREHVSKIISTGYRHTPEDSDDLEWYPPHRIDKVKIEGGAESNYRDRVRAT